MQPFNNINFKKSSVLILFIGIVLAGLLFFQIFYANEKALAAKEQSLSATGTIEATTVIASFKVAGKLEQALVSEGDQVKEGQELAILDGREINSQLVTAQGAYEAALGQVEQAQAAINLTREQVESTIRQTQAKVNQAEIGVKDAQANLDRAIALFNSGAATQKSLDDAYNAYDLAEKKLEEAQAALDQAMSARLNVDIAQYQYKAAQGQVKQADGSVRTVEAYLDNTRLVAPMDGIITQQYLQQGELLNAGTPVYEIKDLAHTFVNIYISEEKIGRVQLNQEAEITLPAYPGQVFKGKVVLISDAGEFAVKKAVNEQKEHNLRSFKVKIDVPNPDLKLKTGMTAEVKILEED
ncbi:MAG: HlyD family efflux transporter periplasmic adaptor subunit [Peptococcaceae bacterium]|nr:HlyD family efflux transporter periplasmic adaptor subunit [Peptococcaceae bacterium]